jgi:pectinesterase
MKHFFSCTLLIAFLLYNNILIGQVHDQSWRSIIYASEDTWYASEQAQEIAENVLLYQRTIGGWPKNTPMHLPLSTNEKKKLISLKDDLNNITIDNGATTQEMFFLSKMYKNVKDEKYEIAFLKGLDYLLVSQYENGGWPQFYPLREGYYSRITYNDDAMISVLKLLKRLLKDPDYYSIIPSTQTLKKVTNAFDRGVDCILITQYKKDGILTSWCAQHNEITLAPAKARAYELSSLSGMESAAIVALLMSIEDPSETVVNSVSAAIRWFEEVKITGLRQERTYNESGKLVDKRMIKDENADPIWARFYDLETFKPYFCDRDGVKRYSLEEIGNERRLGYRWYTDIPLSVINEYPAWLKRITISPE